MQIAQNFMRKFTFKVFFFFILMKLTIDNRERDLLNIITDCEKVTLDLGDIIVYNDDNTELIVFERKTIKDLANSIKDGRHKEQKARLIDCYLKKGIIVMYIIEDFKWSHTKVSGIPYSTLLSSICNTMLRDNIYVYKSSNINETKDFINIIFNKACKGDFKSQKIDYIGESLKLKKKENKNENDSMLFILCQVPRISIPIAKAIRNHYRSIKDLILAYEKCSVDKQSGMLANIQINEKRKLGKVASNTIWKYLCS